MNVPVALLAGGNGDGAVEEEEHAARHKPTTNAVTSRIMVVSFCDRNEDLESIVGLALTSKVDILYLRPSAARALAWTHSARGQCRDAA